jgi:hypothetical protein
MIFPVDLEDSYPQALTIVSPAFINTGRLNEVVGMDIEIVNIRRTGRSE